MKDTKKEYEETKKLFYIVLLIFVFVILLIGVTVAYFSLSASEDKDATRIYTGTLAIDFIDGMIISPKLIPRNEPTLNDTKFAYSNNFSIESTGSLDQTVSIYLDLSKNEFTSNAVKYSLYNESNQKVSSGSIPKSGSVLLYANEYLASGGLKTYTLLLWLQEDYTNQDYEQGKKISGTLRVEGIQIKYE